MATTDAHLAAAVLDGLVAAGVEFAILHNEEKIAGGDVGSDLDVVVAARPHTVIRQVRPVLERAGLRPIMVWDYDVGHTLTVFLATPNASGGVQLDLMCDPTGRGKYGAKTESMLESRVAGARWPTVGPLHRLTYLIRKRHVKQDDDRLTTLVVEARSFPAEDLAAVIQETFTPRVAESLSRVVFGGDTREAPPYPRGYHPRNVARWLGRLRKPAGFWVEITGDPPPELLNEVADRFGRILPVVGAGVRPGRLSQIGWLRAAVAPIRWRAGLYVSGGIGWPAGDLRIAPSEDLDSLCFDIVGAMTQRLAG